MTTGKIFTEKTNIKVLNVCFLSKYFSCIEIGKVHLRDKQK